MVAAIKPISQNTTTTIPPGKVKCYITGALRKDTPEEQVRQRMARSLVEEYGYLKADIALEFVIPMGQDKRRADIVIFETGEKHLLENIEIIVEVKRESIKPSHTNQGIAQLRSYLAATPNTQFGHWVGSESRSIQKIVTKKKLSFEDIIDLPLMGGEIATPSSFSALVPATDVLKDVFKRCHSYIAARCLVPASGGSG